MPVMNVAEFFQVLEKSSLLSEEQFQLARQQSAAESDPKNAAAGCWPTAGSPNGKPGNCCTGVTR